MAVDIDAGGDVEKRAPIIRTVEELRGIRGISSERLGCDVGKNRLVGSASRFTQRPPVSQPKPLPERCFPLEFPFPHALLAVEALA